MYHEDKRIAMTTPRESPTRSSAPRSWKSWFDTRPSAEQINQKAQEKLFQTFNVNISTDECETTLKSHQETVFLFRENFGKARVAMFHHLQVTGGTVYDNEKSYGFIQGLEQVLTMNVTPDLEVLCKNPATATTPVPTTTSLLNVKAQDEIATLTAGARCTYKPRNFIPIVPFMVKDISDTIQ